MSLPSKPSTKSRAGFDVLVGARRVRRKPPPTAGFFGRLGIGVLVGALAVDAAIAYRLWCDVGAQVPRTWPGSWLYSFAGRLIEPFRAFDAVQPVKETGFLDFAGLVALEFYFVAGLLLAIACFALRGLSILLARSATFQRNMAIPIGDALAGGSMPVRIALHWAGQAVRPRVVRSLERLQASSEPLAVEAERRLEVGWRHIRRRARALGTRVGAAPARAAAEAQAVLARHDAAATLLRLAVERLRQAHSGIALARGLAQERGRSLLEGWRRRLAEAEEQGSLQVTTALQAADRAGRAHAGGVRRDGLLLRRRARQLAERLEQAAAVHGRTSLVMAVGLARAYMAGARRDWRALSGQTLRFWRGAALYLDGLARRLAARRLGGRGWALRRRSTFAVSDPVRQQTEGQPAPSIPAGAVGAGNLTAWSNGDGHGHGEEAAISRRNFLLEWPETAQDGNDGRNPELSQLVRTLQERASLIAGGVNGNGHGQDPGSTGVARPRRQRRKQPLSR